MSLAASSQLSSVTAKALWRFRLHAPVIVVLAGLAVFALSLTRLVIRILCEHLRDALTDRLKRRMPRVSQHSLARPDATPQSACSGLSTAPDETHPRPFFFLQENCAATLLTDELSRANLLVAYLSDDLRQRLAAEILALIQVSGLTFDGLRPPARPSCSNSFMIKRRAANSTRKTSARMLCRRMRGGRAMIDDAHRLGGDHQRGDLLQTPL